MQTTIKIIYAIYPILLLLLYLIITWQLFDRNKYKIDDIKHKLKDINYDIKILRGSSIASLLIIKEYYERQEKYEECKFIQQIINDLEKEDKHK